MKIYVHNQGVMLSGKAWEIKAKLKEAKKQYTYVNQWIATVHSEPRLKLVHTELTTDKKNEGSS
ncbi:Z-ring formation inhibitor MciZ [Bacillus sp. FJAT-45037]|uniref:Z-ring formation inhibitor MciZ n=1 Tax=Bacillus sp. FJAT-45037 TaxID=2011007 RepID=UPI000C234BE0|nr:Z-ring formation inhibitor MciZ [Bacillus sp. FJAT-45037]